MLFIYDLTGDDSHRLIDTFDFEAYSIERVKAAAATAGYTLDKALVPDSTHVEHFYDKMPAPRFAEVFAGISPTLFRFQKAAPIA
jgi:hypothetical protein